jgi:hypothetical protein
MGEDEMKAWERSAAMRAASIDYRYKTTMPIRDMHRDGRIFCLVDIYGWTGKDVCIIPGGSAPMLKAVERLGLDPNRYQAMLWDAQV